jgi:putative restriction endonuclease
VAAIVLESSIGSQYEDSPDSYEFPGQYLKFFGDAGREPLFAILYEPRGDAGTGRMKYVGWAQIAGPAVLSGRTTASGRPLYVVHYTAPAVPFDQTVPREILGEPVETWLRGLERGRPRNVATFGRAVRPLTDEDFQRILELGGATTLETLQYPMPPEHREPVVAARERAEVLISLLKRDAQFRRNVISAYEQRCAVSGFGLGSVPVSKASGLLDAAHIRPVGFDGSDEVSNGLPLTPTLHRLFDAGLFTVAYQDSRPIILVSPRLERSMIESPDGRFLLDLRDGMPLRLPTTAGSLPSPPQLRFHQHQIFIREG